MIFIVTELGPSEGKSSGYVPINLYFLRENPGYSSSEELITRKRNKIDSKII